MRGIIYKFECIQDGKKYIGQTVRPNQRYIEHITGNKQYVDKEIQRLGHSNFDYSVLVDANLPERSLHRILNFAEEELIKSYNSKIPNGYNILKGGAISAKELLFVKLKKIFRKIKRWIFRVTI